MTEDMLGKTVHRCRYIYRGRVLVVDATTVLLTDACNQHAHPFGGCTGQDAEVDGVAL